VKTRTNYTIRQSPADPLVASVASLDERRERKALDRRFTKLEPDLSRGAEIAAPSCKPKNANGGTGEFSSTCTSASRTHPEPRSPRHASLPTQTSDPIPEPGKTKAGERMAPPAGQRAENGHAIPLGRAGDGSEVGNQIAGLNHRGRSLLSASRTYTPPRPTARDHRDDNPHKWELSHGRIGRGRYDAAQRRRERREKSWSGRKWAALLVVVALACCATVCVQ
jgi:hypothetical protein